MLSAGPDAAGRPGRVGVRHHHRDRPAAHLVLGRSSEHCRRETPTVDLHCVTKWSKLGTTWRGVSLDVLLADVESAADYALVALLRRLHDQPAAGGPASTGRPGSRTSTTASRSRRSTAGRPGCSCRTCTCGRARSGCAASSCCCRTSPASGRAPATTTTVTHGASSGTGATDLAGARRSRRSGRRPPRPAPSCSTCPTGPGTTPGQHVDVRLTAADGYTAQRSYSIASAAGRPPGRARPCSGSPTARCRPTWSTSPSRATGSSCAARSAATSSGGRPQSARRCCWSPAARASCR